MVNSKDYTKYFPTLPLQHAVNQAFVISNTKDMYDAEVNVFGGGTLPGRHMQFVWPYRVHFVEINPEFKSALKKEGLMRHAIHVWLSVKNGVKKARKHFQFSKR